MKRLVLLIALFVVTVFSSRLVSYDKYRLYRLTPRTSSAVKELKDLEDKGAEIQFWTDVRNVNVPVDILIPHYDAVKIEKFIRNFEVDAVLLNSNVQETIDEENVVNSTKLEFSWTRYHSLEEINQWMQNLEKQHPDKIKLINVGESFEKRNIFGIHLSFNHNNSNKAIFIEANANAREWITSAVSTYILNELLTSPDPGIRGLSASYDFYIVPVFNPDGFAYTKSNNRLWRKTRVPHTLMCYGADFNRNWESFWKKEKSIGNPCSEGYKGPSVFSEPSAHSIAKFITEIGDKLVGYVALHSHHQFASANKIRNWDKLGIKSIEKVNIGFGRKNKEGNVLLAPYIDGDSSVDWVKQRFKIPRAFSYDIRDTGRYGFLIPSTEIISVGNKSINSLVAIFK